jgi:UDP-N-acetylglucosamine transferase subunit ALG13
MIFGTVGSLPFERLVSMFDGCAMKDARHEYVVQSATLGATTIRARCIPFIAHRELIEYIKRAEVVVSHAGMGTIIEVAALGRPLVLIPRLSKLREAINDHQLEIASYLRSKYGVPVILGRDEMEHAIAHAKAIPSSSDGSTLARRIANYIKELEGRA